MLQRNRSQLGWRTALLTALLVLAAGCSSAQKETDNDLIEAAKAKAAAAGAHKTRGPDEVAPGFEIRLAGFDDEALNKAFRIEFDGRLKLPYNVKIDTGGLTKEKLRGRIVDAYAKFFKTPQTVTLTVVEERFWIDIRGLVEKAGHYLVKAGTSLDEALVLAGGLQKMATVRYVALQQGKSVTTIKLSDYYAGSALDRLPPWQGGDILFFQSERSESATPGDTEGAYVQVLGEVHTPGEYRYVKGADFYYFLSKSGGPTQPADLRDIEIVRNTPDGKILVHFGLSNPADIPAILPGDLIFVKSDKATPFERTVPLLGGLVGIVNTVLLMILLF